jgi:hypothetical protein
MIEQDQEATPNRIDSDLSADVAGMVKQIEVLKQQQDQDYHMSSSQMQSMPVIISTLPKLTEWAR